MLASHAVAERNSDVSGSRVVFVVGKTEKLLKGSGSTNRACLVVPILYASDFRSYQWLYDDEGGVIENYLI